uniref:Uncharacterized protein n=1 Tax=Ascaris lumbricoides TaxID=6252 RepID=A0A0M3IFM6_ASCLU
MGFRSGNFREHVCLDLSSSMAITNSPSVGGLRQFRNCCIFQGKGKQVEGRVAQWTTRRSTEPKIAGSNPAVVGRFRTNKMRTETHSWLFGMISMISQNPQQFQTFRMLVGRHSGVQDDGCVEVLNNEGIQISSTTPNPSRQ